MIRFSKLSRCFLAMAALGLGARAAMAQQQIRLDVGTSPDLLAAFATADAHPDNYYDIWLVWRKDANGNTVIWYPTATFTLTKGHVVIHGSTSNNYPERYVFDGQGERRLFYVNAAAGYQPTLSLSGITVQNGYATGANAGGLFAYKALNVNILYCRFLNNKSNLNGSGINVRQCRNLYMYHVLLQGNKSNWVGTGGGGQMAGGGGMTVENDNTISTSAGIYSCTFKDNKNVRGAGLEVWGTINLDLVNSTFTGNVADRRGGAIFFNFGYGTSNLRFNTFAYNTAGAATVDTRTEKNYGGGIAMAGYNGTIKMQGNVLAKNKVTYNMKPQLFYTTDDCYWDGGQFTSSPGSTGNVIGQIANCSQFGSSFSWGIGWDNAPFDPKLSPAAIGTSNDGFALPVHKPASDSPLRAAFYVSSGASCEGYDERAFARVSYATRCDIGSVEFGADGQQ